MRLGGRFVLVAAGLLTACNAIVGFGDFVEVEETTSDGDGGPDSGSEGGPEVDGGSDSDARADAGEPRCNPLAPFGAPELVEGVNEFDGGRVEGAVLTLDELEIFFIRTSAADVPSLRHGRRSDRTEPWVAANLVAETLSPTPTSELSIAAGGLRLYFHDSESTSNYVATRSTLGAAFSTPMPYNVPGTIFMNASNDTVYGPFKPDGGDTVIGRGTNTGTSATVFQQIPNVHLAGSTDGYAVVNASDTRLYFAATHSNRLTFLDDVYVATRTSKAAVFGAPTRVGELSSGGVDDVVTWVSDDDCEILLNRSPNIYRARRPR